MNFLINSSFIILFISFCLNPAKAIGWSERGKVIDIDTNYKFSERWITVAKTEEKSIKVLLDIIAKSETGRKIIAKAQTKAASYGLTLRDVITSGEGSLTDTTLIRRFTPDRPDQVVYETRSKVLVNKRLSVLNAALDLAHELTHFTYRTEFNPYQTEFSLPEFVQSTVEGRGGEVDAYLVECKVLMDIFPKKFSQHSNCKTIINFESGKLSKQIAIQKFYQVGDHIKDIKSELSDFNINSTKLPNLSSKGSVFISSAYGVPYPMAAIKEYVNIMGRACNNDWKRLSLVRKNIGRTLASSSHSDIARQPEASLLSKLKKSYDNRCSHFKSE
jgi:hypothetical protein